MAHFTAAGNYAQRHYQAPFESAGQCREAGGVTYVCHLFSGNADTSDAQGQGPKPYNRMMLAPNQFLQVLMSWDYSATTTTDYVMKLFREDPGAPDGQVEVAATTANWPDPLVPAQQLIFPHFSSVPAAYRLRVELPAGQTPSGDIELFIFGGSQIQSNNAYWNFNTPWSSIAAHNDAAGVITVGAIPAHHQTLSAIQPFSGRGPTNNGALKPDLVAVDAVNVSSPDGLPRIFGGTSAAAPHVAGLLLDPRAPFHETRVSGEDITREYLYTLLTKWAVDVKADGPDYTFGHGRIDGLNIETVIRRPAGLPEVPVISGIGLVAMAVVMGVVFAAFRSRRDAPHT